MTDCVMKSKAPGVESARGSSRYTHLFACISAEEGGSYVVQARLFNTMKPQHAASGEEVADCFETASMLVAALAAQYSIPTTCIDIELRMESFREGTRH